MGEKFELRTECRNGHPYDCVDELLNDIQMMWACIKAYEVELAKKDEIIRIRHMISKEQTERSLSLYAKLDKANALLDEIQEKILGGNYATSAVRKRLESILAKRKGGE